jgi:hypothetical protein
VSCKFYSDWAITCQLKDLWRNFGNKDILANFCVGIGRLGMVGQIWRVEMGGLVCKVNRGIGGGDLDV